MNTSEIVTTVLTVTAAISAALVTHYKVKSSAEKIVERYLVDSGLSLADLSRLRSEAATLTRLKRETRVHVITNLDGFTLQSVLHAAGFRRVHVYNHLHPDVMRGDVIVFDGWISSYATIARAMGAGSNDLVAPVVVYTTHRIDLGTLSSFILCANSFATLAAHVQTICLLRVQ